MRQLSLCSSLASFLGYSYSLAYGFYNEQMKGGLLNAKDLPYNDKTERKQHILASGLSFRKTNWRLNKKKNKRPSDRLSLHTGAPSFRRPTQFTHFHPVDSCCSKDRLKSNSFRTVDYRFSKNRLKSPLTDRPSLRRTDSTWTLTVDLRFEGPTRQISRWRPEWRTHEAETSQFTHRWDELFVQNYGHHNNPVVNFPNCGKWRTLSSW